MSAEPTPAEEPPPPTDVVTQEALNVRLDMFERRLKTDLETARISRQSAEREAFAEIAKREIERERENSRRADTEAWLKRSDEWLKRFASALIGFVFCFVLGTAFSQCNDLHNRLSSLESKQSK